MKRLEWYIFREVVPNFFIAAMFYVTFFLIAKLVSQPYLSALSGSAVGTWILWQVPNFLLQSMPIAVVFAVLMVIGRLSRDNELLSGFASGISFIGMIRPLITFGVVLAGIGLWMAEYVVPLANEKVANTWYDNIDSGGLALQFLAGRFLTDGKYLVYYTGFDPKTQTLGDVRVEFWEARVQTIVLAKTAVFTGKKIILQGYKIIDSNFDALPLPNNPSQEQIAQAYPRVIQPALETAKYTLTLGKTREKFIAQNTEGGFEDSRSLSELYAETVAPNTKNAKGSAAMLGYKSAMPFANLIILMLAIPIAAGGTRSSSLAFGLAVVIAIAYYILLYAGRSLGESGILPAFLGPWIANFLFMAIGIYLLTRQQVR